MIRAKKLTRTITDPKVNRTVIDLGLVGEPEQVDVRVIHALTGSGLVPVVAPVGIGMPMAKPIISTPTTPRGAIAGALGATRSSC